MVLWEKVLKVNQFVPLFIIAIAIQLNLIIVLMTVFAIGLMVYAIDTVSFHTTFIHKGKSEALPSLYIGFTLLVFYIVLLSVNLLLWKVCRFLDAK